ncbi:hypothetical protein ACPPVV_13015 [Rhodanobacter sp. Col0626]|uniref:hypothetical protein n=1 Tax=Rhodanobacter sp. Col0626 TaxID=3415679 RepID=UPI003CF06942
MAQVDIERNTVVDVVHPSMSWGSIIAGWLVAVGIAFLMYVGGLAMGFTAFDPNDAAATAKGIGTGTAAWLVLTWVVSLWIGGMFASWFDGRDDQTTGVMHGITVWGLSIAASGLLLALGMGGAIGSGANLVAAGGGAHGHSMAWHGGGNGEHRMDNDASVLLQAQLSQRIRHADNTTAPAASTPDMQAGSMDMHVARAPRLDPRTTGAVTAALLADHPDTAKALLAANTDMSQADIDATVQDLSTQAGEARAKLKAAADKAAHYAAMAMWVLFLSILLSLLAAALGGWLGASHVHRVYHLRRYARSTPLR